MLMQAAGRRYLALRVMKPWDTGVEFAQQSTAAPKPWELKTRFGLTYRQAVQFAFGFAEGHGYIFPPGFRPKAEWLFRERVELLDSLVLAIERLGNGEEDAARVVSGFGLIKFVGISEMLANWEQSTPLPHGQITPRPDPTKRRAPRRASFTPPAGGIRFVDEEPKLLCAKCLIQEDAFDGFPCESTSKLPIELIGLAHLCGRCGRKR